MGETAISLAARQQEELRANYSQPQGRQPQSETRREGFVPG